MHAPAPPPLDGTATETTVVRWDGERAVESADLLAHEEPLEIRVRGRAISVAMRTPGHDGELAAGFLLTEGVVAGAADIDAIESCPRNDAGNVIDVRLAPRVRVDFERLTRHVFGASSCGLCGKATIDAVMARTGAVRSDARFDGRLLAGLPGALRATQTTFEQTGGLHGAALFDGRGALLIAREDIGRHNAVDKVLGHALMAGWLPLERCVLLVSGRSSFEIMQKAAAGGVPLVAAVSAPSSLAVEFAREMNQTLVGFLRGPSMNVYTHPWRVAFGEAP